MLVLTRKESEQIRIGDDVVLTVVKMGGQSVRIGIQAPQDVRVLRAELQHRRETLNTNAGSEFLLSSC